MRKATKLVYILVLMGMACSVNYSPVDIGEGDMCSFCKMAISERQFAAQIVTEDEASLKFDDIGCMLKFQKMNSGDHKPAATYVANSKTKKWLKADEAFFVRSSTVKTPMGSGIIAFGSADEAGPGALRFSQISEQ